MSFTQLEQILAQVRASLERDDVAQAMAVIERLYPADQADLLSELDNDAQQTLLPEFAPDAAADILEEMDDSEAAELVAALPTSTAVRIIDEMAPDEAADLLGSMDMEQAQAVLAGLEDPDEIRPLLLHPTDTAGGIMTSEFLALRQRMTAGDALTAIRNWLPDGEDISTLFVVDRYGKLCGMVNLRQLIVADPTTPLQEIMESEVFSVPAGTDQEECARLMSRYDLLALPVVDEAGLLMGVITIDDVVDVLEEETTEDIQRLGATEPLDRPYLDTSIVSVFRKRIGWLLLLFLTETLTGSVLRHFEAEIQAVVALSFFIPLLIGTGGNAGSQTTSTIIRALSLGELQTKKIWQPLWHEVRIGLLLGVVMAVVAYGRALLWGTTNGVALTVAVAIFTIVVWANSLGSLLPVTAERVGIDPTVVSGPAMSTLVDATGLFIYFTIAGILL
ncbi:MAG: magnesium transporter [Chloroflexi bacterium]|nr:magnesium transporter [Ardenticatenaceae bacterium]MBL1130173.1 magnesium transporter [Chloroflexota bacterium]NOG36262.1 magnesium transporter [Chloroflexota bacterium]